MTRLTTTITLLALAAVAVPARAQQDSALAPGARVRVVDGSAHVEGTLVRLSGDTVVLTDGVRLQTVTLGGGRMLQRWAGRRHQVGKGALTGALFGALAGAASGFASGSACGGEWLCPGPAGGALLGGAVLGVAGLLTGAILGGLSATDVWVPVGPGGSRLTALQGAAGGIGVGVSVAF